MFSNLKSLVVDIRGVRECAGVGDQQYAEIEGTTKRRRRVEGVAFRTIYSLYQWVRLEGMCDLVRVGILSTRVFCWFLDRVQILLSLEKKVLGYYRWWGRVDMSSSRIWHRSESRSGVVEPFCGKRSFWRGKGYMTSRDRLGRWM
jgi:hypothetical protein